MDVNLLDKAKKIKVRSRKRTNYVNDDLMNLAIAWAKDEVSLVQCTKAMYDEGVIKTEQPSISYRPLARGLKRAIADGKIVIKL